MIQLFPSPDATTTGPDSTFVSDVDAAIGAEPRPPTDGRPWLFTNMIASADGGTAIDGLSGGLGGPGDKAMFRALRAQADIILVGAATVREETYRAPRLPEEAEHRRLAAGRPPAPRLAIVTRSLDLDLGLPLFEDETNRPIVVTVGDAPSDRRADLVGRADIIDAGTSNVDLGLALELLAELGASTVLSEGGPSLNGQLIHAGLIDEWNLSLSPRLLSGDSRRAAIGPVPGGPPPAMRLARVWTDDDFLFCRWVRASASDE